MTRRVARTLAWTALENYQREAFNHRAARIVDELILDYGDADAIGWIMRPAAPAAPTPRARK